MTISNDKPASTVAPTITTLPQEISHPNTVVDVPKTSRSSKLHGRSFYESIGSPKLVLAPMVDQSEFAWRMLSRCFMSPPSTRDLLAYTPMFHARMFSETAKFRDNHFNPLRSSLASHPRFPTAAGTPRFLDGNPQTDRPLFVQFCANDPEELLGAAKYVAPYCDAVDLNLGCPQGIARKGKYGAFLQEDQNLIFRLINKLHKELDVPVTAKIRILDTKEETLEYARNILNAGASILTVHGRTREMKGHKTGLADWKMIRHLRESLPKETVIFANGNILKRNDIDRCLEATGADGVMSAEGNLYNPTIFADPPAIGEEGREYWRGRDGKGGYRMDAVFRRYMDILYKYVLEVNPPIRQPLYLPSEPEVEVHDQSLKRIREIEDGEGPPRKKQKKERKEKTTNPNLLAMQPHLFRLLRPLVSKHHPVRDALARCKAGDIVAFENVLQMVEEVVKTGLREYERTEGKSWEEEEREHDERMKASKEREQEEKTEEGRSEGGVVDKVEMDESSIETVRQCRRPWWVVQPYVRPLPKEALAKGSLTLSKKERRALEESEKRVGLGLGEATDAGEVKVPTGYVAEERLGDDDGGGGGRKEEDRGERPKVGIPKEGLVCG